jgi:hypothetical protein
MLILLIWQGIFMFRQSVTPRGALIGMLIWKLAIPVQLIDVAQPANHQPPTAATSTRVG